MQKFGRELRNYLLDEDKINRYRDYFGGRPETVFRAENGEAAKQEERVRDELNRIDERFVNGDADGIRAILEAAELEPTLSGRNRQRIVLECVSALFDLRKGAGQE